MMTVKPRIFTVSWIITEPLFIPRSAIVPISLVITVGIAAVIPVIIEIRIAVIRISPVSTIGNAYPVGSGDTAGGGEQYGTQGYSP